MAHVGDAGRGRDSLSFGMLADILLRAERLHLLRVMTWGAGSVVVGTALFVFLAVRGLRSPLLRDFGAAMLVLGGLELLGAAISYHGLALRDYAAAVRLDHMLWFELGFAVAAALAGIALAVTAWRLARRIGVVGGGVALTVHALAVALLDLQLALALRR